MPEKVVTVGVELEGAWQVAKWVNRGFLPNFRSDSSVHISKSTLIVGEVASPPLRPQYIAKWIERFYPDVVDSSCGFHVHVAFRNRNVYDRLVTVSYAKKLIEHLHAWGKRGRIKNPAFWARLRGENNHCKRKFDPVGTLARDGGLGDRYTAVNYCFDEHGTIECRVLPMFKNANVACSGVKQIIEFTNKFLLTTRSQHAINSISTVVDRKGRNMTKAIVQGAANREIRSYIDLHLDALALQANTAPSAATFVLGILNLTQASPQVTELDRVQAY